MPDIMGQFDIAFPHLGLYFTNIPKNFTVFGITIALYGVIIACGMLIAVEVCSRLADQQGMKADDIWSVAMWLIIISVMGARLYYVVFSWEMYRDNLLEIFNLRHGGLAIYGGVIAGFITLAVLCRFKNLHYLKLADVIMPGLLIGQSMGRWGNFTNREAFGEYTDSLFAMRLPLEMVRSTDVTPLMTKHIVPGTNYIQVHPTFLYESAWNLCLLILILLYLHHTRSYGIKQYRAIRQGFEQPEFPHKKVRFDGEVILFYLGGYGLGRFLIEGLRTDQLQISTTGIAVSQVLGLLLFVFAALTELFIRLIYVRSRKIDRIIR